MKDRLFARFDLNPTRPYAQATLARVVTPMRQSRKTSNPDPDVGPHHELIVRSHHDILDVLSNPEFPDDDPPEVVHPNARYDGCLIFDGRW